MNYRFLYTSLTQIFQQSQAQQCRNSIVNTKVIVCQLGVNCPSSAQWSLSFMCKLIAVTTKLQLVRQPAGHKWEFQTARVFLLEKQHLHNVSLQLLEMKNQRGKLPPHTPDLKVSIWAADALDRAKSTTQKNSSWLVI